MPERFKAYLPIIPALIAYGAIAWWLNFTQDDAYISYRYVANFLNGHGLVYNVGERVEGYTNFGWVIYLALTGKLGLDFVFVSKVTGFLCGAAAIVVTYLIAAEVFDQKQTWYRYLPVYLMGANLSLAYWSPAGLETAAFALLASLALLWYLQRSHLLILALLLAVLVRPDGAVIAGLLVIMEALTERRVPYFSGVCAAVALALSLPFVVFKLYYYGSILPNPFYAKTGMGTEYIIAGLDYAGEFLRHYGFVGVGLLIPLVFIRRMSNKMATIWLLVVGFTAYIVIVGGDVLKVHRFFLPVMGGYALMASVSIHLLLSQMNRKTQQMVLVLVGAGLVALTVILPYKTVTDFNYNERVFTTKMSWLAKQITQAESGQFSVATTTIGAFGYGLVGHDVIDMLGLTDSTIARHPEETAPGMGSTWKERRHNSAYLLRRAPDYICFSTSIKPSAPAEKSLMLYAPFLESYRAIGWYYRHELYNPRGSAVNVFKKMRPVSGELVPTYPLEFVEDFKKGQEASFSGDHKSAVDWYSKGQRAIGSLREYPELLGSLAYDLLALRDQRGVEVASQALALDSMAYWPHQSLYTYELLAGNTQMAALHRQYLMKLVPWYVPRMDSLAQQTVARKRQTLGE